MLRVGGKMITCDRCKKAADFAMEINCFGVDTIDLCSDCLNALLIWLERGVDK